ncbi:helix-turn-helix transcriptional regulator [Salmonella enterica]|nr:XRE family transcriptional regulator [Salmonella enterica subsp. enterica serovar Gaminara]EAY4678859.1 helix-turn-helix transcriptional regulator [Salmonella enterica]EBL5124068.1 helix-turn-helix transcriptional regulator [Salmonella enterica subsp. enterica serovar Rubislaw]EDV3147888.1 helix-turn-helix transcriptional regulator [Salmonella enterica subsp. enterica serovar Chandans]EKK7514709.1 helix-turn-helix transcriptional regulator [Salmonella enterica]
MSIDYAKKLLHIRTSEGFTQKQFSEITNIPLNTIQKYEPGHQQARAELAERVLQVKGFQKYALWLMTGQTAEIAGQIAPPLSLDGSEHSEVDQVSIETTQKSHR